MKSLIEKNIGKKYTLKAYSPVILLFFLMIVLFIYSIIKKGAYKETYLSTEFEGKVEDIYEERGDTYLKLFNENKRYRINNSRNYNYEKKELYNFLKIDDIAFKNKCSDTLFIKRDKIIYLFIIENLSYNKIDKKKKENDYWNSKRQIMNERNDCN
ncbi:hypothetical protein LXD69_16915 [Flavobacterium sediminilitoris]|uniref:FixH protein n=1 Tax=Flavobacterium sediminilitoris TaxID=2024526 RepID=A0ABY4HLH4_9FLAO|nr:MULTISPECIES: hypothetical protein [Flavobacterium]UOX33702.1 hypothetical protein LXD69_16915 [Flavobacterium sediminilitoris]